MIRLGEPTSPTLTVVQCGLGHYDDPTISAFGFLLFLAVEKTVSFR
jgi:hypothetical protein